MPSKYLIYALVDPRSKQWRYIGKSTQGLRRARQHQAPSRVVKGANPHKCAWLIQLRRLGLRPEIEVVEEFESMEPLDDAERAWIAAARIAGVDLTNVDDGGGGRTPGFVTSPETRSKMSAARRGRPKSSQHRAALVRVLTERNKNWIGRKMSLETRQKMSESRRGRGHSEATREKLRTLATGRTHTADTKAKLSALKVGKPRSEESVLKQSRTMGGRSFRDQNGIVYQTQRSAARILGLSQADIGRVLKGTFKQIKGYVFKYEEER